MMMVLTCLDTLEKCNISCIKISSLKNLFYKAYAYESINSTEKDFMNISCDEYEMSNHELARL